MRHGHLLSLSAIVTSFSKKLSQPRTAARSDDPPSGSKIADRITPATRPGNQVISRMQSAIPYIRRELKLTCARLVKILFDNNQKLEHRTIKLHKCLLET